MKYLIVILIVFTSCRATKDSSAVKRVSADYVLLNQVKPLVDRLWPCINDTVVRIKKGKIDSIPYNVYIPILVDTIDRNRIVDSVASQQKNCLTAMVQSYNEGFKAAEKKYSKLKVPVPTPDTIINTIEDTRKLDIANSSRFSALLQLSASQSAAANFKSERNILFFIVLGLILGIGVGLFFKFKPRL